ncbi:MAG: HD domain-containing protein [Anaerolineaceae bacterium]|nr:HD domain-containing protein [Anaerolineaceae bacterium]
MSVSNFTNIRSLLTALARAMNLINPDVEHHHEQTAYFAYHIADQMQLDEEDKHTVIYAASLHDVGGALFDEPLSIKEIESNAKEYAKTGADMLRDLPDFQSIASVVEYCQTDWNEICKEIPRDDQNFKAARLASIIHLADVMSLCMKRNGNILNQVDDICHVAEAGSGRAFMPDAVNAFLKLKSREVIWLDAMENPSFLIYFTGDMHWVSLEKTASLTKLMSRIIDFRSSFTAMHSAGVAASAVELAKLSGMSEDDCLKMKMAGYLHDVGKLVVPRRILEKPGKLTAEEFNVVKEHPYHTRLILMNIDGFDEIANWAGFHHEKLNGNGYPFHFDGSFLDTGSRIMAVADIFSAITEVRPYRKGMTKDQAIKILREDVENGAICGKIVDLLVDHYEQIDAAREQESREEGQRYFQSLKKSELL